MNISDRIANLRKLIANLILLLHPNGRARKPVRRGRKYLAFASTKNKKGDYENSKLTTEKLRMEARYNFSIIPTYPLGNYPPDRFSNLSYMARFTVPHGFVYRRLTVNKFSYPHKPIIYPKRIYNVPIIQSTRTKGHVLPCPVQLFMLITLLLVINFLITFLDRRFLLHL